MGSMPTGQVFDTIKRNNRVIFAKAKSTLEAEGKTHGLVEFDDASKAGGVGKMVGFKRKGYMTKGGTFISFAQQGGEEGGGGDVFDEDNIHIGSQTIGTNALGTIFSAGTEGSVLPDADIREMFQYNPDISDNMRRAVQLSTLGNEFRRTGEFQTDFNKITDQEQAKGQAQADREFNTKEAQLRQAFGGGRVRPNQEIKKEKTRAEIEKDKNIRAAFSGGLGGVSSSAGAATTSQLSSTTLLGE